MKYVCLVFSEPNNLGPQTETEAQNLVEEHLDYDESLRRSRHFVIAQALQPVETATTIRVRNGKVSIADEFIKEVDDFQEKGHSNKVGGGNWEKSRRRTLPKVLRSATSRIGRQPGCP